jgi:hypothetical protein
VAVEQAVAAALLVPRRSTHLRRAPAACSSWHVDLHRHAGTAELDRRAESRQRDCHGALTRCSGVTVRSSALDEKGSPGCSAADRVRFADRFSSRINAGYSRGVADAGRVPDAVTVTVPIAGATTTSTLACSAAPAGSSTLSERP